MKRFRLLFVLPLFAAAGAAASDPTPIELFRNAEWARHVDAMRAESGAFGKIPVHDRTYDIAFYDIDVTVDPSDSTLTGTVWVRARSLVDSLTRIDLDLIDTVSYDTTAGTALRMIVDSVGGDGVSFVHSNDVVSVDLGGAFDSSATFAVRIDYHGSPRPYHKVGLSWSRHGNSPVIYTMVEPFFAHHWWPCKDVPWDKADSAAVKITAPEGLVAVSNGIRRREDRTSTPGWWTTEYKTRHPIPPYLLMIAISNYELIQDSYVPSDGRPTVPIGHYVYPEDKSYAEVTFDLVPEMIGHLETVFGPYPFADERYGHASINGTGAMEHNTCTSFGDRLIVGNRGSDDVVVHELGHQWWGDLVTCADWNDIWLNEGFATYTEALWAEGRSGAASLTHFMSGIEYFGLQPVYVDPVPDQDSIFTSRYVGAIYSKGAWVLHMLRHTVGDANFFAILDRHRSDGVARGGFASTAQFITICEEVSGMDLERFFREWVYGRGAPAFTVEPFVSASGESLWIRFVQDPGQDTCFAADIDVTVSLASGRDTVLTAPVRAWTDTVVLGAGGAAWNAVFDEANWLLDRGIAGPVEDVLALEQDDAVILHWEVGDPFVTGVRLYAAPSTSGPWTRVDEGAAPLPVSASFDAGRPAQQTYYVLRAVSDSLPGYESTPSNVVETEAPQATETLADSTATNPYLLGGDPYAVKFNLASPGNVSIRVYDISGRLVRELLNEYRPAGFGHRIEWNGDNNDGRLVAPGIYLVRFETQDLQTTRKVVVLK